METGQTTAPKISHVQVIAAGTVVSGMIIAPNAANCWNAIGYTSRIGGSAWSDDASPVCTMRATTLS